MIGLLLRDADAIADATGDDVVGRQRHVGGAGR